ncbi:MAG TPA: CDP-glucose 4,6-dehydratase [Chitinispirillaceae bacterium]|nr:CDP-glucose 4,6-dehydratase [Chitinispirillaceae bacterium]
MIDPQFWKNKRIFLTGNTGFKGSWLSIWLQYLGAEVIGFSLRPPTDPNLFNLSELQKSINWIQGDIRDREFLTKSMIDAKLDIVIHMAAQPLVRESYLDPVGTYATNVMGTVHLLESVRQCETVRAVVVVTTDKCYENKEWPWGYRENEPMGGYDPYSNSKGCAELVISAYRRSFFNTADFGKKHQVALASARAGNVIGGGDYAKDRLIPDIIRAMQRNEQVLIRSPHAIRPWQHVLEPLSGYLTLAEHLYVKGVEFAEGWNFGPDDSDTKPVSWIVEQLCAQWPDSKGYRVDSNPQPHEATYLKLDISKAKARLGWTPKWDLPTALKKIVDWNIDSSQSFLDRTLKQIISFQECK